jgi:glycosyltransferase involved in cell wall biosynthesis
MKELPLVSVAVITYNQKVYLKQCIESILEQDYKNIEIVVADDGSTDGTHELLKEYSDKYPKKFVLKLSDQNQGITKNSNLAHFACNGKYIAWMGGDDLMLPEKIKKQVEYMENHKVCTICHHDLDVFDSDTNQTLYYWGKKQKKLSGNVRDLIQYGVFNGACASMVRKNDTPKYGFDVRVPIASDWLYWVQSLYNGGEIHYIDEVLGRYRRHDNNATEQTKFKNLQDHLISANIILSEKPEYVNEVQYRIAVLLMSFRKIDTYKQYVFSSLKINFSIKAVSLLVLNLLSFGKLKK